MTRYVGLLRAVNLGRTNKVPMAALRELFESLEFTDVRTYIQSGNILFTSAETVTAGPLEQAIGTTLGVRTRVALRTAQELERAIAANPFPNADTSALHLGFFTEKPPAAAVKAATEDSWAPEGFAVKGTHLYLHLPKGMARTDLPGALARTLQVPFTVRTWRTVTKLQALL